MTWEWDAIAAAAELLGALGVIASLVYVAIQVRAHSNQMRQAAAQSVMNKIHSLLDVFAASRSTSDIYVRGTKGLSHLKDDAEVVQFSALFLSLMRAYEELYFYNQDGAVDSWAWRSVEALVAAEVSTVGFGQWWSLRSDIFTPEFCSYVGVVLPAETRDLMADYRRFRGERATGPEGDSDRRMSE